MERWELVTSMSSCLRRAATKQADTRSKMLLFLIWCELLFGIYAVSLPTFHPEMSRPNPLKWPLQMGKAMVSS